MAIHTTEAIVLRRQELRETSLILTLYTRDFGKIKGLLRGVRGPRAMYGGGSYELFSHDTIVFYEKKRGEIYTVSQCDLINYFNPIRSSLQRLAYAAYLVELLDSVTTLSDVNSDVFTLALDSLTLLQGPASARRVARIFEIKLLGLLGLMPTLKECASCGGLTDVKARFSVMEGGLVCERCLAPNMVTISVLPGTARFIEHVRASSFEKAASVKVAHEVGRELEKILRVFLDYHVERRLKTLKFIKDTEVQ